MSRFLGRERELGDLDRYLQEAAAGRGHLVLVGGEPGIGKTHLLDEAARRAAEQGMAVAVAACRAFEGVPPLWPWAQVVRQLAATDLLDDADLAHLLAEGETVGGLLGDVDPAGARFRLFDRIATGLRTAAATRPALVILDDLQWADRSSLHVLGHLSPQLSAAALVVVGAYRDVETSAVLDDVLPTLPADTERVTLTGLSPTEVAGLARELTDVAVDDRLVATMSEHTAGNPLFVTELVRLLEAQGHLGYAARWATMPAGIRDVLDRRVARLSTDATDLLAKGAVIGREFDVGLLSAVAGLDPIQMADRLDEAVRQGIVRENAPDRFAFTHDLFRHAHYDRLGPVSRAHLHHAAGEAIEARHRDDIDDHLGELAHHYAVSVGVADAAAKAVTYGRRAAERAARLHAFDDACHHLERALDVAPPGASATRAELLLALGEARRRGRDLPGARAELRRAAEMARTLGDSKTFATAALAFAGGLGGNQPLAAADVELIALLDEALDRLADHDGAVRCRVMSRLAIELYLLDEPVRRARLSAEAVAMARRLDDPGSLAFALYARQIATHGPDGIDERVDAAHELLALADQVGDRELALWAHLYLDWAYAERCLPTTENLATAVRLADELALPGYRAEVALRQAVNARLAGRADDSRRLAAQAQEGDAADLAAISSRAALQVLEPCLAGPYDDVAAVVDGLIAMQPDKVMWHAVRGVALVELGREDEARLGFDRFAADGFEAPRDGLWLVTMWNLAYVCFALRHRDGAVNLLQLVGPHADHAPITGFGSMATPLGLLDATVGRFDEALAWLEESHRKNLAVHNLAAAAFTRREHAAVLLTRGAPRDGDEAHAMLTEVVADLRRLGFDGLVPRAERLRAQIGGGLVRNPVDEPDGVSAAAVGAAGAPADHWGAGAAPVLARDAAGWVAEFGGAAARLEPAKGIDDLAVLLARPGEDVAAVDLAGGSPPAGATAELDEATRRALRERLRDLDEDLAEAEAFGDLGRAEKARMARDELLAEASSAFGFDGDRLATSAGGDTPNVSDAADAERARKAVTWRVRRAIEAIEATHPELGRHLRHTVRTGARCRYDADPPVAWHVVPEPVG